MVNSGRLSVPCVYDTSPLNSADALAGGPARSRPGAPCPDVPLGDDFLLSKLGDDFVILTIDTEAPEGLDEDGITARRLALSTRDDPTGLLKERYLGEADSAVYLIRPDQHVAARRDRFNETLMRAAIRRAAGKEAAE